MTDSKRIAYLTSEYPAISHTFIQREVEELRRRGIDIETFSVRPPNPAGVITEAHERERESTFVLLKPKRLLRGTLAAALRHPGRFARTARTAYAMKAGGLLGWIRWAAWFAEGVHLGRELELRGIGHLHNHFANASANVALFASSYSGVPFSFTLHGLPEMERAGIGSLSEKLEKAKFFTTICDFNRAQALRMTPLIEWDKVHIARCGLDLSQFPLKSGPRREGPVRILSVARLSKEKGIPGLIEAFATAVAGGLDAELILIGDGPEREHVERQIEQRGLQSRVDVRGRQAGDAVRDAYVEADIFALPSLMEGLPIVLMEAMATGTPVIAPSLAGIPELVVHDDTGLLFTPAKWSELAEAISRLGKDEELRARLAQAGRAKVEAQHDIRRAVVPLLELFGVDESSSDGGGAHDG